MGFDPENKLEESLLLAAKDPAYRPQFYRLLLESDLFILYHGSIAAQSGTIAVPEGPQLDIQSLQLDGRDHVPVFSSVRRMQALLRNEAHYIRVNAAMLLKSIGSAAVVLNPGSECGKQFTPEEIASILDGSIWNPMEQYVASAGAEIQIGQPAEYPYELVEALKRLFRTHTVVKRAWIAQIRNLARNEAPHTLIAIEMSGDWNQVVGEAGMVAREVAAADAVDFWRFTGHGSLEHYFTKVTKPFYRRRSWGLSRI